MKIRKLAEAGNAEALLGLSFSYGQNRKPNWDTRGPEVARKLALKQGGHNKFLESMIIWLDVTAPRYWWQQADTYRLSTKQSESTMHTLIHEPLTNVSFASPIPESYLTHLNDLIAEKRFDELKGALPESFLQRRMWCMSYKTFQNMWYQRKTHKLGEWTVFLYRVLESLDYPYYITG